MPLENSINDQNKGLYEWLTSKGIEISFSVDETIPSWQVKGTWKISAPSNEVNPAAMAHELLHIKLYARGFSDDISIYRYFNRSNSPFTIEFISHTNNDLAHFKMVDDFLKMGFPIDDFLQDTPKTYFLEGMIYTTTRLIIEHKVGAKTISEQILGIIRLVTGAKFFELYKIKDPSTTNGLHPDAVLGKEIEITAMKKPIGGYGSIFEFKGESRALGEIGLEGTFYYTTSGIGRFANELGLTTDTSDLTPPSNEFQRVLSIFLYKSIFNGRLTNQFEAPFV